MSDSNSNSSDYPLASSAQTVAPQAALSDEVAPSLGVESFVPTELKAKKEKTSFNKLQKKLRRSVGNAIVDFDMIEAGDRVMVCLSGGKDSYTLLDILIGLQKSAPIDFELFAVNLDQKQPGFPPEILPNYLDTTGVPYQIVEEDTYSTVTRVIPEGKTMCSLCSRLRRGILYRTATEIGATKIALGHHRDDMMETMFLNMFHGGKLKSMPPKLLSDDKKHVVLRPLAYCKEKDIEVYAENRGFPIIPCNLCGSQENLQRQAVKRMLQDWDQQFPGRLESIFGAMQNTAPSHLLDRSLYDFKNFSLNDSADSEVIDAIEGSDEAGKKADLDFGKIDILNV